MRLLSGLSCENTLKHLDLSGLAVHQQQDGLQLIAQKITMRTVLTSLSMCGIAQSSASVHALGAAFSQLPALCSFTVSRCHNVQLVDELVVYIAKCTALWTLIMSETRSSVDTVRAMSPCLRLEHISLPTVELLHNGTGGFGGCELHLAKIPNFQVSR